MAKSKRTATELQLRLASLKRTYDARRNGEPSGNAVVRRKVDAVTKQLGGALVKQLGGAGISRKVVEVVKQPGDVLEEQSASAAVELQGPSQLLAMPCSSLLPLPDAIRVLASVFSDTTARYIHQYAGRTQNDAEELLPPGVAAMIKALGPLSEHGIYFFMWALVSAMY
ncbi:hypothetical protein PI126_g1855 [Phytophthora idaei]|nr:hypothetical protein PI126_g1855 [Phytophthora idaei]